MNTTLLLLILNTGFMGYFLYSKNKRNIRGIYFLLKSLFIKNAVAPLYKMVYKYHSLMYCYFYGIKQKDENNEDSSLKKEIKYEEKYMEKYNNTNSIASWQAYTSDFLENLKNNIIIENTPLGNVLMYYDNKRETFVYFSDNSIPYRYLEVVSRKYVTTYNCKNLYVNMEKELEDAKKKQKEKELEDAKKKEEKEKDDLKKKQEEKNVLPCNVVKFKNYNTTNIGTANANAIANATTSFSKQNKYQKQNQNSNLIQHVNNKYGKVLIDENKEEKDKLLKEKANRYSYDGKLVNYNFLKKVDKKEIDKRLALNYSQFKALYC
jgi:hypothetical protein